MTSGSSDDRIAEEEEEDEETTSQSNSKAGATKGSKETNSPTKRGQKEITILESQMENKEEDEEIEQFSEDDENAEVITLKFEGLFKQFYFCQDGP